MLRWLSCKLGFHDHAGVDYASMKCCPDHSWHLFVRCRHCGVKLISPDDGYQYEGYVEGHHHPCLTSQGLILTDVPGRPDGFRVTAGA
jgi:hypothetical protein